MTDLCQYESLPDLQHGNDDIEESESIYKIQSAGRDSGASSWDNPITCCRNRPSG